MESGSLFYDSIEDETSPTLLPMRITPPESDISLIVPLYKKETSKSELMSTKSQHFSPKSRQLRSKKKTNIPSFQAQRTFGSPSTTSLSQLILDTKQKKSYVDLFHAKIGYVQGTEATETSRAVCDDDSFKTARSSAPSEYSDAETSSFVSDTSFYKTFLENEKLLTDQMKSVSCRSERKLSNAHSKCDSAFTESSQNLSASTVSVQPSKGNRVAPRKRVDREILKVPTLGGLGPDREACREKLDKLKRQQKYGQKVSNQNRVKLMEMKVMKNFKFELKKSSELNKCAESVLSS